jgi:hypothetical protein
VPWSVRLLSPEINQAISEKRRDDPREGLEPSGLSPRAKEKLLEAETKIIYPAITELLGVNSVAAVAGIQNQISEEIPPCLKQE